ncbi:MAG: MBL fold metallo-hydrolase [Chloroflexi bacterium]|nr:MAG: MBL fold metallo-hydrolase [Chloroflexota bacterium]
MSAPIRIELPTNLQVGSVNAYLFTEPEPVLIDTGLKMPESWAALLAGLQAHGVAVADLRRIVITHPHVDHCGQAGVLAEQCEAVIEVADVGYRWLIEFPEMWRKRIAYYQREFLPRVGFSPEVIGLVSGYMEQLVEVYAPLPKERVRPFASDGVLELGGMSWQVLYMPGHASTQTCFYQPETRQFIAADMLLPKTPTPIVERPSHGQSRQPALPIYLQSLDKVEALDIQTVYPGHGDPFTNHRQLIQKQRARIQLRKEECYTLIQNGHHTVLELLMKMYAHYPEQIRFAGLWMLVGYLDLLKADGLIIEKEINGVWHYETRN